MTSDTIPPSDSPALDWRAARATSGRLTLGRSALVVVDVCLAYTHPDGVLNGPTYAAVARRCGEVLARARDLGVPVVHTKVEVDERGRDAGVFWTKGQAGLSSMTRGNPWGEPDPAVTPAPGELVVTKQYASAFFGTSLASTLHSWGVESVVVTGVSTSGCVRATAVDACQLGLGPFVVADAVGDKTAPSHDATLFDVQAKYGEVLTSAELFAAWDQA